MGSRRGYDVSAVVGTGRNLASDKGAVTRAVGEGEPEKIASSSARLVGHSQRTGDFFFYGLKLLKELRRLGTKSATLTGVDLDKQLRKSWSKIKREEGIGNDPALDKVVLDAAKAALRRSGR